MEKKSYKEITKIRDLIYKIDKSIGNKIRPNPIELFEATSKVNYYILIEI